MAAPCAPLHCVRGPVRKDGGVRPLNSIVSRHSMRTATIVAIATLLPSPIWAEQASLTRDEALDCVQLRKVMGAIKLFELETRALPANLQTLVADEGNGPYLRKSDLLTPSGPSIEYIVDRTREAVRLIGAYTVIESIGRGSAGCIRKE